MQINVFSIRVQLSLHALSETRVSSPFLPRHLAPWTAKDGPCSFQRAMFCFSPTATHGSMLRLCTLTPGFKQWSGHFPQKFLPTHAATDTRGASGGFLTKKAISSTYQLDIFARLTQTLRRETNKKQPQTFSPWWTQPHSLTTSRAEMINQWFSKIITWGFNSVAHKVRQKSNEEPAVKCLVCTYRQAALLCQWERPGQPGRFQ